MELALLVSVFIVATCGLVYELISGALASYLLGDSITQFSIIIGTYLFAMGVGSFLSKYIEKNITETFIKIEILIGLIGGSSAAALFLLFGVAAYFQAILYGIVFCIGVLVGLEIPLLMRILKDRMNFSELVARVLSFDYVGALAASLLFPLVFVPYVGLVRTAFFFGILNVSVALWVTIFFRDKIRGAAYLRFAALAVLVVLTVGFALADVILNYSESALYPDPVIYAKTTPYQRIALTRRGDSFRLYLSGHLQFDSRDEYRYHEPLVHLALSSVQDPRRVLILGGGDGLAAREVLRNPKVVAITLVDLDAAMTSLFQKNEILIKLNQNALSSSRLTIVNTDAFRWLRESTEQFDVVIMDFPDPTNYSLGKLYTTAFFHLLKRALAPGGIISVQSTSPLLARRAYWCVEETMREAGFSTLPFHSFVPSFGEWGFILGGHTPIVLADTFPAELRFLTTATLPALLQFPWDMSRVPVEANRLNNQALVRYYEEEWSQYSS